jgi:hypothetical protein
MKSLPKVVCVAIIALFVGLAIGVMGQTPHDTGPLTWKLVWNVFALMSIPAVLGYWAGRNDEKEKRRPEPRDAKLDLE